MEDRAMTKTLSEMNNTELFNVLAGGRGIMAQFQLQQIILAYRQTHKGTKADLMTMVQDYLQNQAA